MTDKPEAVNHPAHYGGDVTHEVYKCLSRAGKKGDRLEDLKKARWYLDREIERLSPLDQRTS